jgi:hypothetical protein
MLLVERAQKLSVEISVLLGGNAEVSGRKLKRTKAGLPHGLGSAQRRCFGYRRSRQLGGVSKASWVFA